MKHRVLIAVLLAFVAGFVVGVRIVQGTPPAPAAVTADLVFRAFELPDPTLPATCCVEDVSDYAAPLRSAPTASPPPPTARPKLAPTAGHTSSGSGTRTISRSSKGLLGGYATWHATGRDGFYAAAGPALRKALGSHWRGAHVLVSRLGTRKGIEVVLNDWCACGPRNGYSTLLDLSDEAFAALAPLSRGVIRVVVDLP